MFATLVGFIIKLVKYSPLHIFSQLNQFGNAFMYFILACVHRCQTCKYWLNRFQKNVADFTTTNNFQFLFYFLFFYRINIVHVTCQASIQRARYTVSVIEKCVNYYIYRRWPTSKVNDDKNLMDIAFQRHDAERKKRIT